MNMATTATLSHELLQVPNAVTLSSVKGHPALSKRAHRAIDAALVILSRGIAPATQETSDNCLAAVA
jgi:hypothetical protein